MEQFGLSAWSAWGGLGYDVEGSDAAIIACVVTRDIPKGALVLQPLKIDWTFHCFKCGGMASMRTCPHGKEDRLLKEIVPVDCELAWFSWFLAFLGANGRQFHEGIADVGRFDYIRQAAFPSRPGWECHGPCWPKSLSWWTHRSCTNQRR